MSAAAISKKELLKSRASCFSKVRAFFAGRSVMEVDCLALESFATIDAHIDPLQAENGFLHTSPEYGMKKLLAEGCGDIYQHSHVFRREEKSPLHSVEFSMLEWYRLKLSFEELIDETCELIQELIPNLSFKRLTYREAFEKHLCSLDAPIEELRSYLDGLSEEMLEDSSALIDLCFAEHVEPNLPEAAVITDFPAKTAALAKVAENSEGELVARRFEIYLRGIEVANGYDELQDSRELRRRFESANRERLTCGKKSYAIDEELLEAIEKMPPCVGVAVGFDRLVMLATGLSRVSDIQA